MTETRSTTQEKRRAFQGPALFSYGFRPFFLGAALWAAFSGLVWIAYFEGGGPLAPAFDPVTWHAHEFLFGYLGAVVAGFLLTAVPNWTGRLPVMGWPLAGLTALWVAGRLAVSLGAMFPAGVVAAVDLAFPVSLAVFLAREILAGRNWKNLIVLATLLIFLAGNAVFHVEASQGLAAERGLGLRLGLAAGIMLVAVVGGRIVPSFTRNWLVKAGRTALPTPPMQGFDRLALAALLAALALWSVAPDWMATGIMMLLAGTLHAVRLARWQLHQTLAEPLVWVLHLAFAFIPLGALTLGLGATIGSAELGVAGLHIWTIGALGLMPMAVMTRATLGHTGGALHAGPMTVALYLCVLVALILRLAAWVAADPRVMIIASAGCWSVAFLGFAMVYGPRLLRPRG